VSGSHTKMKSFLLALLFAVSGYAASAAEPYLGTFIYQYDKGNTYRVTVPDNKTLTWECIEGSEKGAKGEEHPDRFKVADKIYFATWVEKTGIVVTQVLNFKSNTVHSTIVEGKDRYVLVGKINREK